MTEQNVVPGMSMGGLVARYALAEMTKNSEDPETCLLITYDSPHRGANVPLGIQYFLQMFGHLHLFGFIDVFKQLYSNTAYSSGSQLPVDGVAGATYPLLDIEALKKIEDVPNLPPINLAINVHLFYIFGAYFDIYAKNAGFSPQFCFVPTSKRTGCRFF